MVVIPDPPLTESERIADLAGRLDVIENYPGHTGGLREATAIMALAKEIALQMRFVPVRIEDDEAMGVDGE